MERFNGLEVEFEIHLVPVDMCGSRPYLGGLLFVLVPLKNSFVPFSNLSQISVYFTLPFRSAKFIVGIPHSLRKCNHDGGMGGRC